MRRSRRVQKTGRRVSRRRTRRGSRTKKIDRRTSRRSSRRYRKVRRSRLVGGMMHHSRGQSAQRRPNSRGPQSQRRGVGCCGGRPPRSQSPASRPVTTTRPPAATRPPARPVHNYEEGNWSVNKLDLSLFGGLPARWEKEVFGVNYDNRTLELNVSPANKPELALKVGGKVKMTFFPEPPEGAMVKMGHGSMLDKAPVMNTGFAITQGKGPISGAHATPQRTLPTSLELRQRWPAEEIAFVDFNNKEEYLEFIRHFPKKLLH